MLMIKCEIATYIQKNMYCDLRGFVLMDLRFIIYLLFICLKNFELSWVISRTKKVIKIHFIELGMITTISEIAGFCFIVSQSQSADLLLWWKENVFLNKSVCICGFVISVALSVVLLFLLLLFKKQLKHGFIKLSVFVLFLCSPYLFFFSESQMVFTAAVSGLLLLFIPICVSSLFTYCVYIVDKRINKNQDIGIDFRLGEVIWALISRYIGLTATIFVLIITPLKLERLFYANTLESILLPLTAFSLAVIFNSAYLLLGVFKGKLSGNRQYILYSIILPLLNAPYIFLYPIMNNILVSNGVIQGMYAPM